MEEMQEESLADEMRSVVEEARMVIPGAQALFGFQTIAAFNTCLWFLFPLLRRRARRGQKPGR